MASYDKFCQEKYLAIYEKTYNTLLKDYKDKTARKVSDSKQTEFENASQKEAMKQTIVEALLEYPTVNPSELWKSVKVAHIYRKSKISDLSIIENVISSEQSWKKSSGHAFEEVIKDYANVALSGTNVRIILQRDLSALIESNYLDNEVEDYNWLKIQISKDIFDLYAIVKNGNKNYCYGCIQSKTSIRDRVTRDREPSVHAMEELFWSVIVVLDESFMHLPKFKEMVDGGTPEFPENGWNGMYLFTDSDMGERIYRDDITFERFKKHALKAAEDWLNRRKWMNHTWKAE